MKRFDAEEFKSYFWKANLRGAVDYLRAFPEQKPLLERYLQVFEQGQTLKRTDNGVLAAIDAIYQDYYRDVFWQEMPREQAKTMLFRRLWVLAGSPAHLPQGHAVEGEIKALVEEQNFHYLGGDTQGFYGPYIWKDSERVSYKVELTGGIELFSIVMMDGFVSRSWMEFISFGLTGAAGWAKNGVLSCVRSVYDLESPDFQISFLKHEAQHAWDQKHYGELPALDLEYRAKLVELIYWPDHGFLQKLLLEADQTDPNNSHTLAAHRIISGLSRKMFACKFEEEPTSWYERAHEVPGFARELLDESTRSLQGGAYEAGHDGLQRGEIS